MLNNKSKPRLLAVAKVIKVLTKILLSYSDKIQLLSQSNTLILFNKYFKVAMSAHNLQNES